ncbi:hypothetical protein [Halomonas huangheensis]|uniref:Uncharacterized protein n=1 Tax=Halomonas huangheensis TaxID=1178482 RepID=W1NC97_9GAMM|nr:hypothetical protein [Halomonas huangheensis]ALM54065.1 hypothetical protein AR456_18630 [Halomonas huangheensis]ERL52550.1 hypothetical protein BJB45_08330 [Halomonas huangheensis]
MDLLKIMWPMLEKPSKDEISRIESKTKADIEKVKDNDWGSEVDVYIDEARRIHDQENNRRSTAETKAGVYLAVVGAFAPLLASLATFSMERIYSKYILFIYFGLIVLSFSCLFFSGLWALRALNVVPSSRVDIEELVSMSSETDPKKYLLIKLLVSSRFNRKSVNDKVTCVKMANAFLVRAVILITLTLLLQGGYPAMGSIFADEEKHIDVLLFQDVIYDKFDSSCHVQVPLKPNELCVNGSI